MAHSLQLLLLFGLAFYSLSHTNKVIDRCWEKYGNVAAFALRFSHAHAGGTSSGASCASAQRPPSTASVCCANSLPLTGENGRWSSRRWAQTLLPLLSGRYGAAAAVAHSLRNDILRAVSHEQSLRPHVGDVRPATTHVRGLFVAPLTRARRGREQRRKQRERAEAVKLRERLLRELAAREGSLGQH